MHLKSTCLGTALTLVFMLVAAETQPQWEHKVEPSLLRKAVFGETEFLVVFSEQADVSEARVLPSKKQKGEYVFLRLTEVAERTQATVIKLLKASGLKYQSFWVINMICVRGSLDVIREIALRPEVTHIWINPEVGLSPIPHSPSAPVMKNSVSRNLVRVRAPEVWALGYTGQGVVVGGQDTGYQWDHPALIRSYRGWNGTNVNHNYNWHDAIHPSSRTNTCGFDLQAPCDDNNHGTRTMGIMVGDDGKGNQVGMAPGARWIGARNMNGNVGSIASYTECFQWFLAPTDLDGRTPDPAKGPDVINNSWLCYEGEGCMDPLILKAVVDNVRAAGIVVVGGAGNDGPSCSTIYEPPAIYDAVMTVGATYDTSDYLEDWSSRGPVTVDGSGRQKPNVCAPGYAFSSSSFPQNSYVGGSGTSMAAPHAAGLVALVLSAHPELKGQVEAITRLIERTAVPGIGPNSSTCGGLVITNIPNNFFGWGRIDAVAALAMGDRDSDGIPDWWMLAHFGHADGSADDFSRAADDADRDGVNNFDEYVAGTDPLDSASYFFVIPRLAGSTCTISFQSSVGRFYTLVSRAQLIPKVWQEVVGQVNVPGTGEVLQLMDSLNSSEARFYAVQVRVTTKSSP